MATSKLISREEVLRGLTGGNSKQASALLLLLENRTAYLTALSQQAMDEFLTEEAVQAHPGLFRGDCVGPHCAQPAAHPGFGTLCPAMGNLGPGKSEYSGHGGALARPEVSVHCAVNAEVASRLGAGTPTVQVAYQLFIL